MVGVPPGRYSSSRLPEPSGMSSNLSTLEPQYIGVPPEGEDLGRVELQDLALAACVERCLVGKVKRMPAPGRDSVSPSAGRTGSSSTSRERPAGSGTGRTTAAEYGCTALDDHAGCQQGTQQCPIKVEEPHNHSRPSSRCAIRQECLPLDVP